MAIVTLRGESTPTCGELPDIGTTAPGFTLLDQTLQARSLSDFYDRVKLIYTVPSLDTQVCAKTTRQLVERLNTASTMTTTTPPVVIVISADLPFAQQRFSKQYKLDGVVFLSLHRNSAFALDYGLLIEAGPLTGLLTRALLVLDQNNIVRHTELVAEISKAPDFDVALALLNTLTENTTA